MSTLLPDAISEARGSADLLNVAALDIGPEMPAEDALRLLHSLRIAIEQMRKVDASLVRHIYLAGEHGDVRLDGLPAAKVTRGRDRKAWDSRGAVRAVIDKHMAARAGEPVDDPWDVAEWLLEVLGIGYLRVTPLRAHGLDPEDYCTSSPGALSVQFAD